MYYNISTQDFANHVRHATGWKDLTIRCGLKLDMFGVIYNHSAMSMLHQKVHNMRLNIDHFSRQKLPISDDDFKTIVKESFSVHQVMRKCKIDTRENREKILNRIEDLDIDTSHFKEIKIRTGSKSGSKVDAIDDETFKTLVKDNTTWRDLLVACGFHPSSARQPVISRIEKLGLNRDHLDARGMPDDKVFVVDSEYHCTSSIKKRLLRDFDLPYECARCQNQNFTKCDGVLMWNKQKIVLQLEHKNGINNDNRLENLELLCPNCHSQTSTYAGGNSKKRKAILAWLEEGKTSHAPGSIASLLN
jgi:hypothetical protein